MRRKIAPTLSRYIQGEPVPDADLVRELRALLAVARAAERMFPPANWTLPALRPSEKRLARALARLDRSSRPQRAGRGRA